MPQIPETHASLTSLIHRPVVDLSHHQPPNALHWKSARAFGIVGALFKVGQGAHEHDPAFSEHTTNAMAGGIPLLGGYLFLDTSDPAAQASSLLNRVDEVFGSVDRRRLALDLESNPMGATETVAAAAEVAQHVQKQAGKWPLLYMGVYGPDGKGTGLPNETLDNCDLWLPCYGEHPRLPKGFRDASNPGEHGGIRRLWQDTDGLAHRGTPVPGLGRVDQSTAVGFQTLEALTAWWIA